MCIADIKRCMSCIHEGIEHKAASPHVGDIDVDV